MNAAINSLTGKTVASITIVPKGYGLPGEVKIKTTDGHTFTIDNRGLDEGEMGHYPCLNFHHEKPKEPAMIDKNAQRQRAASMTAALAAQGLVPPKQIIPPPKPKANVTSPVTIQTAVNLEVPSVAATKRKPARYERDAAGKVLHIGDRIATTDYGSTTMLIGKIIGFTPKMVKIEVPRTRWNGTAYTGEKTTDASKLVRILA